MKPEIILTVSVAAYNVEKYIENTLDSLLADESILDRLEILVIDDGGTDSTIDIAGHYSKKYPGVVVPVHKENGGYGSVINCAIEKARGVYFKQLDGDDWFDRESFPAFVRQLETIDADAVMNTFYYYDEPNGKMTSSDFLQGKTTGYHTCEDLEFSVGFQMYVCTFKTEILRKMNYRITENCFYTDTEYSHAPVNYIDSIYVSDIPVYVYRRGTAEQSMNPVNLCKRYLEHERILYKLIDIYNSIPETETAKRAILRNRVASEAATHIRLYCYRSFGPENFRGVNRVISDIKTSAYAIYEHLMKKGKLCRLWVYTKGMVYPLVWLFYRFKGMVRT